MKLSELDKNFAYKGIVSEDWEWLDRFHPAFSFDGCVELEYFWRLPVHDKSVELPFEIDNGYPSTGIRLRFKTDATRLALRAQLMNSADMATMARGGSHGFDVYVKGAGPSLLGAGPSLCYVDTFRPDQPQNIISSEIFLPGEGMREVLINFPLYNGVTEFFLGIPRGAQLEAPDAFSLEKPIVFYGSSITQGACASRPGNAYTHLLAARLDAPMLNLGFSGRAKGEPSMARYIASLPMSVFVMDYDHNAETPEELLATHETFFKIVRAAQPQLPIIIVSRPNADKDWADADARFEIIRKTYERAVATGDTKVWLVDGRRFFGEDPFERQFCTVDGCHPNDLGFYRMYQILLPVMEEALKHCV